MDFIFLNNLEKFIRLYTTKENRKTPLSIPFAGRFVDARLLKKVYDITGEVELVRANPKKYDPIVFENAETVSMLLPVRVKQQADIDAINKRADEFFAMLEQRNVS